jgi:hypothetical protein
MPGSRDMEHQDAEIHALPESRRTEHGTEDAGRDRANQASRDQNTVRFIEPPSERKPALGFTSQMPVVA